MSNINDWPILRLEEVIVDMQPGFAQRPNIENVGVPQLRTNNISSQGSLDLSELVNVKVTPSELNKFRVRYGDVIFNNTNSKEWVGKTAFFDQNDDYVLSNHMTRVRPNISLLDAAFLARYLHYLWQIGLSASRAKQWVNQAAIDQAMLAQFEIPLPSLPEQHRIVAILRQADRLRQLRQEANKRAGRLVQALFDEMFGDPFTNLHSWRTFLIEDLLRSSPHYGTFAASGERGKYLTLRVGNVVDNGIDISDKKYVNLSDSDYKRFRVLDGDVLIVRAIGSASLLGKCAVYHGDDKGVVFDSHLMRLQLATEEVIPEYFQACLASKGGRMLLSQFTRASAVQYNINTKEIQSISIPVPPFSMQEEFLHKSEAFNEQYKKIVASQNLDTLFQSFLAQALMGKLTAEWREQHKDEIAAANALSGTFSEDGLEAALNQLKKLKGVITPEDVRVEEAVTMSKWEYARNSSRQELIVALSDEQWELFEFISKIQGYFTIETVLAGSGKSQLAVRQGLQLFTRCGLIQQVFLPDRPMRDVVVYVPALRNLTEADRSLEPDLLTPKKFENAAMNVIDSPEGEVYS